MERQVKCECGYVARAGTEDEVVADILDHIGTDHPDLLGKVDGDQIRTWIEIVA
jgi:predicted small metal-binding protein